MTEIALEKIPDPTPIRDTADLFKYLQDNLTVDVEINKMQYGYNNEDHGLFTTVTLMLRNPKTNTLETISSGHDSTTI